MKSLGWMLLVAGCSFTGQPSGGMADAPPVDGDRAHDAPRDGDHAVDAPPTPIDAAPDAREIHACLGGYQALSTAGTASTYKRVAQGAAFATAETTCEADGAHLVIPETTAEARAVYALVAPDSNSPYYWAGVQDQNHDGVWLTVKGTVFANPPWAPTQPNNSGSVAVLVGSDGAFYDWPDGAGQQYACECDP